MSSNSAIVSGSQLVGASIFNLTSQIVTNIDRAAKCHSDAPLVESWSGVYPQIKSSSCARKIMGDEDKVIACASTKLQKRDICGAICCLCSEEILALSSNATHQALLTEHPPRPADRRPFEGDPANDRHCNSRQTSDLVLHDRICWGQG